MGQRSDVDDVDHLDAGAVDGADGAFAAVTGTFDIGLHFAETEVVGGFGAILSGHLGSVGSIFLGTAEAHLAG